MATLQEQIGTLYGKICQWDCIGRPTANFSKQLGDMYFVSLFPLCSGGSNNIVNNTCNTTTTGNTSGSGNVFTQMTGITDRWSTELVAGYQPVISNPRIVQNFPFSLVRNGVTLEYGTDYTINWGTLKISLVIPPQIDWQVGENLWFNYFARTA